MLGIVFTDAYQMYAVYLKLVYARTNENKWPPSIVRYYFSLVTVHKPLRMSRNEADAFTRATLHHGIDEIVAEKEPIAIEDVLKPLEGQTKVNCVLVEGPPGVGKSTFAWELCQRWDSILDMKKFSLVVLLRFRDKRVQEAKNIADLFYHDDDSIQQAVAKEVCNRSGEGLLLILDGFDEFPAHLRKCSLLLDIIKSSRLPGCTVIVTSRSSATADLIDFCTVDKRIEVLGFTNKEIEEYASAAFASEPQLLDDFHQYRKLNPAIRSMMYIPLNTVILVDVFLDSGEPLSHTVTGLYLEMSRVILIRYLKESRQHKLADQLQSTKLHDLPSIFHSYLLKLEKLAFKGTVQNEVIFNEFPIESEHFGFLNALPELYTESQPSSSNFLHRSFQDLFTAFQISQLLPSEQKAMFHKYSENDHFKEVWRFVAGLTGFKAIGWEEVKSKCSPQELVSYLYEAQDIAACDSVLGEMDDAVETGTLFDCYAAGWCIAASECRLKLGFNDMGSGAGVCEAFSSGVKSRQEVRGSVAELHLSGTPIKEEDVVHLMELPSSIWHKTTELGVSECGLDASAMGRVAEFVELHVVSLKCLYIRDNNVGEGGLVQLFESLSQHKCLESLSIGDNSIGCADVEALARLIRPDSGRLKELGIVKLVRKYQNMSPECQKMLMETLLQPSSLESLRMRGDSVSSAFDSLALLADNTNLTSLDFNDIGPALCSMLEALKDNKAVKTLKITNFHSADIGAVVGMLTANKYLDTLNAVPNYLGGDEQRRKTSLDIIDALKHNKSLKRLEIYSTVFTQTEKDKMDPRVFFS